MRGAGFIRQWQFLRRLEANRLGGVSLAEAAEVAAVSERTIRRDIDVLILVGFPIEARTTADGTRFFLTEVKAN